MPPDFYDMLGVARDASEDEVRSAYRKLAHRYHPDKTGGDKVAEEKLKEINEAYGVLKNKNKRAHYDRYGSESAQFGAGQGAGFQGGVGGASPFDDIFDAFFSGGRGGGRGGGATRGDDLEYALRLTLRDAAFGLKKKINFHRLENCGECKGSGAAQGTSIETCSQCGGVGQVRMSQGFFSISRACPACSGTGRRITKPCTACRGNGQVETERELAIDIPAGVDTGSKLRVPGEGEPGRGNGPRGDLYIAIVVDSDAIFSREGNNIICEVPIQFTQATLGTTIRVPGLSGEADLKIPAGTQSGTVFKLRGLGMPDLRGYRHGDQLVKIQVETPAKLSKEQKELIRRFEELCSRKTYPLHIRFLDRLKASLGK